MAPDGTAPSNTYRGFVEGGVFGDASGLGMLKVGKGGRERGGCRDDGGR